MIGQKILVYQRKSYARDPIDIWDMLSNDFYEWITNENIIFIVIKNIFISD